MADYRIINQKVRRYLFTKSEIDWLLQNDYLDFVPKNILRKYGIEEDKIEDVSLDTSQVSIDKEKELDWKEIIDIKNQMMDNLRAAIYRKNEREKIKKEKECKVYVYDSTCIEQWVNLSDTESIIYITNKLDEERFVLWKQIQRINFKDISLARDYVKNITSFINGRNEFNHMMSIKSFSKNQASRMFIKENIEAMLDYALSNFDADIVCFIVNDNRCIEDMHCIYSNKLMRK